MFGTHALGYGERMVLGVIDAASTDVGRAPGTILIGTSIDTPVVAETAFDLLLTSARDAPRPWVSCDVDATLGSLTKAVGRAPDAAVMLAQVLRTGEGLPVDLAIQVESLAYSTLQHSSAFRAWREARTRRAPRLSDEPVALLRMATRLDIVLQRPEVHNAFDARMRDALCEAFDLVALDTSITDVHLRGAGPSFCSGGDLDEFGTAPDAAAAHLVRMMQSVGRRVHACSSRVTAHVHGACIGAGIEISAFAGRVVADPSTTIRLPEVAMGLIPGAGGTVSIPRRIGRHRTMFLALLDQHVDLATATRWGLVDTIVS